MKRGKRLKVPDDWLGLIALGLITAILKSPSNIVVRLSKEAEGEKVLLQLRYSLTWPDVRILIKAGMSFVGPESPRGSLILEMIEMLQTWMTTCSR